MAVVLPDAINTVKFVIAGTTQLAPYVNTFHLQGNSGNFTQADMDGLASAVSNAYWNNFGTVLNTATTHVKTQAIDLSSRTGFFGSDSTSHTGSHPGTSVSSVQIACCVSWLIQDRYRGGHPRMYLPAADTQDIIQGRLWSSTALGAYQTAASGFYTACQAIGIGGRTYKAVCVRYFSNHQLLTTPFIRPITQAAIHTRVDSMRRRLGKETV